MASKTRKPSFPTPWRPAGGEEGGEAGPEAEDSTAAARAARGAQAVQSQPSPAAAVEGSFGAPATRGHRRSPKAQSAPHAGRGQGRKRGQKKSRALFPDLASTAAEGTSSRDAEASRARHKAVFPDFSTPARETDGQARTAASHQNAGRRQGWQPGDLASPAATAPAPFSLPQPAFVPMSREEMQALGWEELDVLLINGDAYVDHPSFGAVLLARWLIYHGFRTGIVAQPRWDCTDDFLVMGRPRLFAGVSAGALDSMLAHYTAFRKKRHDDAYTPGGRAGARPNRACLVYANLARQAFPGLPLILGGIEASLRRVTHYDFWTDSLRRPILMDAKADLLIWGMGETAIVECARRLARGAGLDALHGIPGTAWLDRLEASGRPASLPASLATLPAMPLPSAAALEADPQELLRLTQLLEQQVHRGDAWAWHVVQNRAVVLAPPAPPLTTEQMDQLYGLPFNREAHPVYTAPIPAAEMMRTSITSHRGCGGGCSFCSLALHQGRHISSRSAASILAEARALAASATGRRSRDGLAISDVGGPTANMWQAHCALDETPADKPDGLRHSLCRRASCCFPTVCKAFVAPQRRHVELLRAVAALPHIKQVRVASGIRADLALHEPAALAAYTGEFTGGQLKVAPEHCTPHVLELMRKPGLESFEAFLQSFMRQSRAAGREQYVVPYLMSAFPGCTDEDMYALAHWLRQRHWNPQQTQCFIPTPGTIATAMYYCGTDEAGEPIEVARTDAARLRQHHILMPVAGEDRRSRHTAARKGRNSDSRTTAGSGRSPAAGQENMRRQDKGRTFPAAVRAADAEAEPSPDKLRFDRPASRRFTAEAPFRTAKAGGSRNRSHKKR